MQEEAAVAPGRRLIPRHRSPIVVAVRQLDPGRSGRHDATHKEKTMKLNVFKSKIHRATVTHADLDYEGSITIDADLLDAADIIPNEVVHVWNITNGSRLTTYCLEGPRGSKAICMNGAAAHLTKPGDLVIIATFADMTRDEAKAWVPKVVLVDRDNAIVEGEHTEQPGPVLRSLPSSPGPAS